MHLTSFLVFDFLINILLILIVKINNEMSKYRFEAIYNKIEMKIFVSKIEMGLLIFYMPIYLFVLSNVLNIASSIIK